MLPVVITGLLASQSLCKTTDIHREIVQFSILWEMLCMLKEDEAGGGEEKVEDEKEESIRFKILRSLLQSTGGTWKEHHLCIC